LPYDEACGNGGKASRKTNQVSTFPFLIATAVPFRYNHLHEQQ